MKHLFLFLAGLLLNIGIFAQNSAECNAAIEKIYAANAKHNNITSNFTQTKHMVMMDKEIVSNGVLNFVRPDKLKMEYTTPKGNLLEISGDNLILVNGGKKNSFSTKGENKMKNLRNTLLLSIGGDINGVATENNAKIEFSQNAQYYIFTLDKGKGTKSTISKLELSYSKKDLSLCVMIMHEPNGNYTTYDTPTKDFK